MPEAPAPHSSQFGCFQRSLVIPPPLFGLLPLLSLSHVEALFPLSCLPLPLPCTPDICCEAYSLYGFGEGWRMSGRR